MSDTCAFLRFILFDLFTKKEEKNKAYCYAYEILNTG